MQKNTQTIEALLLKKKELLLKKDEIDSKIEKIDEIITLFENDVYSFESPPQTEASKAATKEYVQGTIFPPSMPLEDQVIEAFKSFGHFMKLQIFASELKKISKTSRTEGGLSNFVRELKKGGNEVVMIKFNGSLTYSYWGLSSWLPGDEGSIKDLDSHAPVADELSDNSRYELVK